MHKSYKILKVGFTILYAQFWLQSVTQSNCCLQEGKYSSLYSPTRMENTQVNLLSFTGRWYIATVSVLLGGLLGGSPSCWNQISDVFKGKKTCPNPFGLKLTNANIIQVNLRDVNGKDFANVAPQNKLHLLLQS